MHPMWTHVTPGFAAFDALAETYDQVFTCTKVGRAQREVVWREMDRSFKPGDRVLEINCGTGADAIHLAQRRVHVVACDASEKMIHVSRRNADETGANPWVEFVHLPTEHIFMLDKNYHFDGLLSNFGGLNCSPGLSSIACDLAALLKPRAQALICVFSPFCAGETLWYLSHAKPRKAFRRLRAVGEANVGGGATVQVYRHTVRSVRHALAPYFQLKRVLGVGIFVPPSYVEGLMSRFPWILKISERMDQAIAGWPVFRNAADHMLMHFERTETCLP